MRTEFTVRTTDRKNKKNFSAYRSKESALEAFNRSSEFHSKKNDDVLVELFKVVYYDGVSVHHVEKIC